MSAVGNHEIEPYRPDGGISLVGLLPTVIGSLLAAIAVGYLVSLTRPYVYIPIVSPFLIGAIVGIACFRFVRIGHLRNPYVAGILGLASGTVCMLAPHYFGYLNAIQQAESERPGFRAEVVSKGKFTFADYMDAAATRGVTIGKVGDTNPSNLGYVGSFIYWFVEMVMVVFIVFCAGGAAATAPYCRSCSRWKKGQIVAKLEGYESAEAVELVKKGELGKVLEKAVPSRRNNGLLHHLHLKLVRCPNCGVEGTAVVMVLRNDRVRHPNNHVVTETLTRVVYPSRIQRTLPAWVNQ